MSSHNNPDTVRPPQTKEEVETIAKEFTDATHERRYKMDKLDRFYTEHRNMELTDQRPVNRIRRYLKGAIVTKEYAASINGAIRMYYHGVLAQRDPEVKEELLKASPLTLAAAMGMACIDSLNRSILINSSASARRA